ncbi:hypothetical protein GOP47_0005412 [Adiantum capillus-veneris]|uniref:Uncharacterized protein n=1 Tax=Adiantum capillus-veneris TaxID=13818 RepID=A0A9D4V5A8_ADICA|nr:hypothetical protein GOP47_0005412 [Adiantum capillus-veneris]
MISKIHGCNAHVLCCNENAAFHYQKGLHTVYEVNRSVYESCDFGNGGSPSAEELWGGGVGATIDKTSVIHNWSTKGGCSIGPLNESRVYYFACGVGQHCLQGVCNLCNGGVNMVLDNDPNETMRFAALQSPAGRALLQRSGRSPDDISSIVLVEKDRSYIKSEAVLRIANYLRIPFPLIAGMLNPFPLLFRDIVYDTVANNRYNIFGQTSECRLTDTSHTQRFIEQ